MDFWFFWDIFRKKWRVILFTAFAAATMSALQHAPVDMLMYYDFRPSTSYCGFYDLQTEEHMPVYYAFYAWSHLRGSECECKVDGGVGDVYSVAAVDEGRTALLLTRYNGDNNACNIAYVKVSLKGKPFDKVVYCHLTDDEHIYTEIPLFPAEDGSVCVEMKNNSIALIEF